MMKSIEGVFRNGKVELLEPPPIAEDSRVLITFLTGPREINLSDRGIDPQQARDLSARLKPFSDDWNRPEMDVYDEL